MAINQRDALNILGINTKHVTETNVKKAYRRAAQKYHPDRNPAGLEMMKLINAAYDALQGFSGDVECEAKGSGEYSEQINTALNAIINFSLDIEICGAWVWVSGNTKPNKDTLQEVGFKWASKKLCWYFRPEEYKSRNHKTWSMDSIRNKYGSQSVRNSQRTLDKT